ncbi:MAG: AAA family ATPase [Clostridia bacterium]|nr:AAA family ATPase [Clostridia bacterium]
MVLHKNFFVKGINIELPQISTYPFNIPSIVKTKKLEIDSPVTFFVGENGSGKSTLIEALAVNMGFNPEGGSRNMNFSTCDTHSHLSEYLTVSKKAYPKDGFFLRAESFYNVASYIQQIDNGMSTGDLQNVYGGSLHECSHGESFLKLLSNRLFGNGLYILDEPEAALSIHRLFSMLCIMKKLVDNNSQFIIATHSPILLSYPNSTIYQFSDGGIERVEYKETEPYKMTKYFLDNPERMLELLFESYD